MKHPLLAITLSAALVVPAGSASAQSFPRLPKIELPGRDRAPERPRTRSENPRSSTVRGQAAQRDEYEMRQGFDADLSLLLQGTTPSGGRSPENDAKQDENIGRYLEAAERLAGDFYGTLKTATPGPARIDQVRESMMREADRLDQNLGWDVERVSRSSGNEDVIIGAFNNVLDLDTKFAAAMIMFPDEPRFGAAKAKTEEFLLRLGGSRQTAAAGFDDMGNAAAANVRMPAAIAGSAQAEAPFRRAWASSGIPYTIMRIHVTSGWRDKIEYGRLVGQRRDAAIAARDPSNPNRCNLYDFTVFRDRSGNVRRDSHSTRRIACENVSG